MKEKHTSSKKPSIRIPIKSSSPKSFEKLEYANSKSEIADNSKNSSFLDAFDSVNNDVDDDLETVNLAGETEPDIPIESSVKKVIENVRIKDTTLDNGLDDNTMNDTRVSDHSTLINDKRQANVSFEKKVENLPVKVVSSIENEVTQLQTANSPVNKSFSKNKKRKHFLVMPKKLKNLSKKPSKK
ncbi:uncharacterized protein VICG_00052 [Vittaforma corneae ATCC 50505]|uniref:Uncharacterized protein n=1 Tax=Vittaforma corneae (strain ATCC 50505) TaxID=993615 RepID=L2GQZ4_VITCO|nr:uncharacterized protein VICG_00052 [Vittaforma corneae ATCC 50505]ELA42737.1 hypothetical protein VICG_00052 [Vittaforma corneae ATCC 50505]